MYMGALTVQKILTVENVANYNHIRFLSHMQHLFFEPGNSGGLVLCPPDKLIHF